MFNQFFGVSRSGEPPLAPLIHSTPIGPHVRQGRRSRRPEKLKRLGRDGAQAFAEATCLETWGPNRQDFHEIDISNTHKHKHLEGS